MSNPLDTPTTSDPRVGDDWPLMSVIQRDTISAAALVLHTAHEYAQVYPGHPGADAVRRVALTTIKRSKRRYGAKRVEEIVKAARDTASQISCYRWSDFHFPTDVDIDDLADPIY